MRTVLALLLCGCSSSQTPARDLSTVNDLAAVAADLAPRSTAGIACGADACAATAYFCCTSTMGATGTCLPNPKIAMCADAEFFCDGPEDCPPATPICCVASGIAQCASSCAGGTVMCHLASDCGALACCPAPSSPYALCLAHC